MGSHVKKAAFLAAILGLAAPAFAETAGGGGDGTSPGTTPQGESETGVGTPGDAPADNRTIKPEQPDGSTGSSASGDTRNTDNARHRKAKHARRSSKKPANGSRDESGSYSHEQKQD